MKDSKLKITLTPKGYQIKFQEKPSDEIRKKLKSNGWSYNGILGCWYAKTSEAKNQEEKFVSELQNYLDILNNSFENEIKTHNYDFFVKEEVEFDNLRSLEPLKHLSAKQAIRHYNEFNQSGKACVIGINIPGDNIFNDPEATGASILTRKDGIDNLEIFGDIFIKQLRKPNNHSENVISAYKDLYQAAIDNGLPIKNPEFLWKKEAELKNLVLVGRITYYDSGEVSEYYNEKDFLEKIKECYSYQPSNIHIEVESDNAELLKAVDDEKYNLLGEENPYNLSFYQNSDNKKMDSDHSIELNKELNYKKSFWEESIQNDIDDYFSGEKIEGYSPKSIDILNKYKKEWNDNLSVSERNSLIGECYTNINDLPSEEAYSHSFKFYYDKKTPEYSEYDGTEIYAPNEKLAWVSFSSMDGEYKLPETADYHCEQVEGRTIEQKVEQPQIPESPLKMSWNAETAATGYVLDKLKKSGIEVVTDKDVFNKLLNSENRLQKMVDADQIVKTYFRFTQKEIDDFNRQIDQWETQKNNPGQLIEIGKTSPLMKYIGIPDFPIKLKQSVIAKALRKEPVYAGDKHGHNLSLDDIRSIPQQLADPVMVFKSRTRSDSYVFFTEKKDNKDRSILIPIAVNKKYGRLVINEITSIYGKDNEIAFVRGNINKENLIYMDKKRSLVWERYNQVQFLTQRFSFAQDSIYNILTKERLVNFLSAKQLMLANGTTYGFAHDGKIYLNPDVMNSNVAVHEYTHLWDKYTQKTNPELWQKGKDIFKNTKLFASVKSDPNYADIAEDDDLVLSEVHSRICGKMAEQVLKRIATEDGELVKDKVIDWDKEVWNYIGTELLQEMGAELKLNPLELKEFLATPMKDMVNGLNIGLQQEVHKEFSPNILENGVIDYTAVNPKDIFKIKGKEILSKELPSYLPPIDIRWSSVEIPVAKIGENEYLIKGSRHENSAIYKVNLDVLAALEDYHQKYQKAVYKEATKIGNEQLEKSIANGDERTEIYVVRNKDLPTQIKPVNFEEIFTPYYPVKLNPKPHIQTSRVSLPNENAHSVSTEAIRWIEENVGDRFIAFKNRKETILDVKQKLLDMELQYEDNESTYFKGKETSYGDSNINDSLCDTLGINVKRQNGDLINKTEIKEIEESLKSVYDVFGNFSGNAKDYGLKISHAGSVNMHASKACGMFLPGYQAIGVSRGKYNDLNEFTTTLAHESAHFLDNLRGIQKNAWHSSDIPGTKENKIANVFRNQMKPTTGKYYNRTCECFARAMEEYAAIKLFGEQEHLSQLNAYCSKENFKNITPLINDLLDEYKQNLFIQLPEKQFKKNIAFTEKLFSQADLFGESSGVASASYKTIKLDELVNDKKFVQELLEEPSFLALSNPNGYFSTKTEESTSKKNRLNEVLKKFNPESFEIIDSSLKDASLVIKNNMTLNEFNLKHKSDLSKKDVALGYFEGNRNQLFIDILRECRNQIDYDIENNKDIILQIDGNKDQIKPDNVFNQKFVVNNKFLPPMYKDKNNDNYIVCCKFQDLSNEIQNNYVNKEKNTKVELSFNFDKLNSIIKKSIESECKRKLISNESKDIVLANPAIMSYNQKEVFNKIYGDNDKLQEEEFKKIHQNFLKIGKISLNLELQSQNYSKPINKNETCFNQCNDNFER